MTQDLMKQAQIRRKVVRARRMRARLAGLFVTLVVLAVSCGADPDVDSGSEPATSSTPIPVAPVATEVPAAQTPTPIPEPPAATPTPVPTPTPFPTALPTATPVPPEPTVPAVSDEVPTTQELLDIGLTENQAECFITTIDPDGTGRIEDADLFLEALGTCT